MISFVLTWWIINEFEKKKSYQIVKDSCKLLLSGANQRQFDSE